MSCVSCVCVLRGVSFVVVAVAIGSGSWSVSVARGMCQW